jgi:hypothetical protein
MTWLDSGRQGARVQGHFLWLSSSDQSESSIRLIESVSDWLADYQRCRTELSDLDVPCGDCAACCQSSMFILIRPQDTEAK